MEIRKFTALGLGERIRNREVSVLEAVKACMEQIERREKQLHAYIMVDEAGAKKRAQIVQKEIDSGRLAGPLVGVVAAVKDNICVQGMGTTCGSRMLSNFVPTYSAEVIERLERAGVVILGKTNMDEFAMGSTTETSTFGVTRNPHHPEHVPGGSSGGSCAAVAAEECFYALGSDTGGSIRQPSAFCGVVGLKPTYGTVSRYGLVAYGSSLDQVGPIGKDVADCAAVLDVIAGRDPKDSTSVAREHYDFLGALKKDVKGLRVGIPKEYIKEGVEPDVKEAVLRAAKVLEDQGANVEQFHLDLVEYGVAAYYTIASAEASSNLARFDGIRYGHRADAYDGLHEMYQKSRSEGFGTEVKRRIMLGTFVLSAGHYDAYYLKALKARTLIKQSFDRAFERYDVLLGPVAAGTAPKLSAGLSDPMKQYLSDIYTVSVNLAGLPAMSVPFGCDANGLPIGVQLIGDCFQERQILCAGQALEQGR